MSDRTKALVYILISTLAFSVMGAFVKTLQDIPVFEKVFFRNSVSLLVALYVIMKKTKNKKVKLLGSLRNQKFLLSRSLLGLAGVALNFYAITHLYLADSQMLNRTSPFFVTLFAFIFLKEKLPRIQLISMITALAGALMVIKPSFDISILPGGSAILAAICAGAAYTLVRFLRNLESPETIVFYFSLVSVVAMFPVMLPDFVVPNFTEWMLLIGTGVTASFGQFGLTHAYRYAKASEVSIYTYTGIIFSALIGFFCWGEIPDTFSIFGGIIIIFSAVLVYYYNNHVKKMH